MQKEQIWEELEFQVDGCKRCILGYSRKKSIMGRGSQRSPILFVGETPSSDDEQSGIPFSGAMGDFFDKILKTVELSREEIYLTHLVKCRPSRNRMPSDEEIENCSEYLQAEIALLNPKIIVTLGSVAAKFFLKDQTKQPLSKIRGELFAIASGITVIPLYHPNFLLRQSGKEEGSPKYVTWQDMLKIRDLYNQIKGAL